MGLRIGFFSDDTAASLAAAMAAHGLAAIGRAVAVAAPEFRPGGDFGDSPTGPLSPIALPDRVNAFEVQSLLERFALRGGDSILALPLVALRDRAVRIQFDAVITVGRDLPAAERALGAARYATGETVLRDGPPAWFLACGGQHALRTRANLRPEHGPGLPFAVRALPAAMPRPCGAEGRALLGGRPDIDTVRDGILLAVLVVAVAADPHARRLDAGTLDRLMATRDLAGERATSDLLVGLAGEYERLENDVAERVAERWATPAPEAARHGAPARRRTAPAVGRPVAGRDDIRREAVRRKS